MIIVIDGYNLLRAVFYQVKGELHKERERLVRQLGVYHQVLHHEIVVVFDGGQLDRAVREVHGGVVVVFAGYRRSADDWIVDYVARHAGKEIILVTRDRGIIKETHLPGVDVVDVEDFYARVQQVCAKQVGVQLKEHRKAGALEKYERVPEDGDEEYHYEELDELMAQATEHMPATDKDAQSRLKKRSEATKKVSKVERQLRKKVGKL